MLLDFASSLDFESYIADLEFRECVGALRDRAKNLEREERAFAKEVARKTKEAEAVGGFCLKTHPQFS